MNVRRRIHIIMDSYEPQGHATGWYLAQCSNLLPSTELGLRLKPNKSIISPHEMARLCRGCGHSLAGG